MENNQIEQLVRVHGDRQTLTPAAANGALQLFVQAYGAVPSGSNATVLQRCRGLTLDTVRGSVEIVERDLNIAMDVVLDMAMVRMLLRDLKRYVVQMEYLFGQGLSTLFFEKHVNVYATI